MSAIPAPYKHQEHTSRFLIDQPETFVASDPGTGKTRAVIDTFAQEKAANDERMLVVAPLSILRPSWGQDIDTFQPHLSWAVAHGAHKEKAFTSDADVVVINHDGVKWLAKKPELLRASKRRFGRIVTDESTAFKHRTSQRSKAAMALSHYFRRRTAMTGTPDPRSVLDMWHQMMLVDHGARLGNNFYRFRGQVCEPKQTGPRPEHVQWVDKEGAAELVAGALADVTIRYRFEDCLDIPPNKITTMLVDLPPLLRKQYEQLLNDSVLLLQDGRVDAVNAAVRVRKLLQLLTGAIYDSDGKPHRVHSERYEIVMDLVEARAHSLVAFNWKHERDELLRLADSRSIAYGVIDGDAAAAEREEVVRAFQAGELQAVFAHPQSAAHGLTLTRGTTTIWCSPTYNAEHYQQFNRRIYRAGQTQRTETIRIAARGTKEVEVYDVLEGRLANMDDLLGIFTQLTRAA